MNSILNTESVTSKDTFVKFLEELNQDLKRNPTSWENNTLADFLEAFTAWVNDMDGYYAHRGIVLPAHPTWGMIAEMFAAARVYE